MDFFEAVEKRRSVRRFTSTPVPKEVIDKAIDSALLAPNSSNLQPWEFYWVRSPDKKEELIKSCFSQGAARTAAELVIAVSRVDTWRRNAKLMIENLEKQQGAPKIALDYYKKLIPMAYVQGPLNTWGWVKRTMATFGGVFRPVPRGPSSRSELFEVVTKTTALACENFMLAVTAQGYGSCPMEGFDEKRVKKLLGLGCSAHVVMVIGVGEVDSKGVWGPRVRFDRHLFVREI